MLIIANYKLNIPLLKRDMIMFHDSKHQSHYYFKTS